MSQLDYRPAAVPMWYQGTLFRSTLEADWAATLDTFAIGWQYEPVAVSIDEGEAYLCDFYLPALDVWAEVKGPHNLRLAKTGKFSRALTTDDIDIRPPLVVVLRPPTGGEFATWESVSPDQHVIITSCPQCEGLTFLDVNGPWLCRRCYFGGHPTRDDNKFWKRNRYESGSLVFMRAPRPDRGARRD